MHVAYEHAYRSLEHLCSTCSLMQPHLQDAWVPRIQVCCNVAVCHCIQVVAQAMQRRRPVAVQHCIEGSVFHLQLQRLRPCAVCCFVRARGVKGVAGLCMVMGKANVTSLQWCC